MSSEADRALANARSQLGDDVVVAVPLKPRQSVMPALVIVAVMFVVAWLLAQGAVNLLGRVAGSILVTVVLIAVLAAVLTLGARGRYAHLLCRRAGGSLVLADRSVVRSVLQPDRCEVTPVRPPLRAGDLESDRAVPVEVNGRDWTVSPLFLPELRVVLGAAPDDPR